MNKQMNLPALSNIMREFDRQNERMEMTSEMMGDAVDDAFEVCSCTALCSTWACITYVATVASISPQLKCNDGFWHSMAQHMASKHVLSASAHARLGNLKCVCRVRMKRMSPTNW